ncbi:MAG: radical SAM protein, partial [Candidatus Aureabacteria bacterium]|nr:radical SAM protein [Candidatus Auribacterota bacterium]
RQTPIYPLDNIPLPARDLFNIGKTTFMFTSRGCLYRCAFCASSRFWSNIRFFSAEYVVNEIMKLREKYGVKHISFLDDLFSADVSRVREILALLKKKGILGKIKFACSIRANKVNDGIISMFKEMGVESIGMGLESGCDESLEYLKGDVTVEDNYQSVRTIRKFGISVFGSFIIGSPNEDMASIMKTLEFIKKSHVDKFGVYMLTPFPGTPVWDYAESRGLVGKNMNWDSLNVNFKESHKYAVLLSEKLTRQEIYELWMRFERYKFRQRICYLVRRGLQNPFRIPRFILEKLGRYWRKIWLISPS